MYNNIILSLYKEVSMALKVRVRYIELEVVNFWPNDPPDFDEIQKEVVLNMGRSPSVNQILRFKEGTVVKKVVVQKSIVSNIQRADGLSAFVQAKII
jgi:hypothetical protein